MRLNATAIGCAVPRTDFTGCVHSVFQHACNLRLADARLIVLLASGLGDIPHGARLDTPAGFAFDALGLQPGQPVACHVGVTQFEGSALSVDLRTARVWDADLPEAKMDLSRLASRQAWQAAWDELCSDENSDGLGVVGADRSSPLARRAGCAIDALLAATQTLDAENACAAAEALIGLGPGLTPSGDDFLVGYLTSLWRTSKPQQRAFAVTLGAGIARLAHHTNDISRAYLEHAAVGHASRALIDLARAIGQAESVETLQRAMRAALDMGSTSGADGVLGLLLGLDVWQRRVAEVLHGK